VSHVVVPRCEERIAGLDTELRDILVAMNVYEANVMLDPVPIALAMGTTP